MIPLPHVALIPGLDYCKCKTCGKWIATDYEIEALERRIDKLIKSLKNPQKSEELQALRSKLSEAKRNRSKC